jgi:hypothetical protein
MSDKKETDRTKQDVEYKIDRMVASKEALINKTEILTRKTEEFSNANLLPITQLQTILWRQM